ncbi:chromosome segregation protein SMC [Saccharobesus litoralis]|uniref:Chromosome partition protein Smc n=1 Tax=Saccharobesus litoralis TaxID=2172099 RepID=A0A2S0VTW4_9ALTE|nr:chromosome segregation protein SMC [Saccharobesus litoralis]AWB67649.1 chromosome segregation protein SMC [Saccharobesus litoralis]
MRLKQIKLAGFKSFVDPTTVPFPAQMTAIVGPNGCGKSNIIDAVRWVLGESSAKNLRGDAMTDVIFNGSSSRKPVSQASIELVFDNSEGRLQGEYAAYNEISIKRLVTREAVSNYFLNGNKCRKKDITELFLGTGLGPRSYAIIEQGMISRLIESKPQELRIFIEEAAGISKYKERRRETENRIRHSRDNLARLDDVRIELQQQLEKLQRQAAAARRFKELKAKERKYKSEHCVLRWIRLNSQTETLDSDIKSRQIELEKILTEQSGGATHLDTLKTKQSEYKHSLELVNQQLFAIAQQITKAEQQQLHLREKKNSLVRDSQNQQGEKQSLTSQLTEAEERLAELEETLSLLEPEHEELQEQVEEAAIYLEEQEQDYETALQGWQTQSEKYYQIDNELKSARARIVSIDQLMAKSQQRISRLQTDLNDVDNKSIDIDTAELEEALSEQKLEQEFLAEQIVESEVNIEQLNEQLKTHSQSVQIAQTALQKCHGQIASLETLIERSHNQDDASLEKCLDDLGIHIQGGLFDLISVEPGWELAVETVLNQYSSALITHTQVNNNEVSQLQNASAANYLISLSSSEKSEQKPQIIANTLATKVQAPDFVIRLLNNVLIDTELACHSLGAFTSVISQTGYWYGNDWCYIPGNHQDSVLALKNDLLDKQALLNQLTDQVQLATQQKEDVEIKLEQASNDYKSLVQQSNQTGQLINKLSLELQQVKSQQADGKQRKARLMEELDEQKLALEEELMEKEELQMNLETIQEQLIDLESNQQNANQQKTQLSQSVSLARQTLDQQKNTLHQAVLKIQSTQGQIATATQAITSAKQRVQTIDERGVEMQMELDDIDLPLEEAAIQLQESLEQKAEIDVQRVEVANALSQVDDEINELEKGQHGVFARAQKLRDEISALQVEREGYHVRANSVLEALNDTGQHLKDVLQSLPEEADEQIWSQELEKTTQAINRLGAINLAAIEEYEHQSERKQYLDAQHDDLVSALETLEEAIRKIDRETRTKFKQTFDVVNDDLQRLFPKVFGGGAAWLELTGEDLLDTGVTIMARPPGKRNSTIHLLSGGEKALTALSLVFAIFRLNPAPFCMLDEVDAPLDDANVGRFCRLVNEMSASVQFIFISHNKIAMEMATNLVGVTMQEPGCSRMVAVDVDKAIELAEAS